MSYRSYRLLGVLLAGCLYGGLFLLNLLCLPKSPSFVDLRDVGIASTNGLLFLVAGVFLWLTGRNRLLRTALFFFCLFSSMNFTLGSLGKQPLVTAPLFVSATIAEITAPLAISSFVLVLFLLQWRFFLTRHVSALDTVRQFPFWGWCYFVLLGLFTAAEIMTSITNLPHGIETAWEEGIVIAFYGLFLVGIIAALVISWLAKEASPREQFYHRLLIHGLIFAIGPFLLLTLFPSLLAIRVASDPKGTLLFDPVITTTSFCLLPMMLVYAAVRYQLLVPERVIERIMRAIIAISLLGASCWAMVVIALQLGAKRSPLMIEGLVVGSALIAGPLAWVLARRITVFILSPERIFFYRLIYEHSLIDPSQPLERILQKCILQIWRPKGALLFLYDQDHDKYRILPNFSEAFSPSHQQLLARTLQSVPGIICDERGLSLQQPTRLLEHADPAVSLRRLLGGDATDSILVPFQSSCRVGAGSSPPFALLILGEQEHGEPYASPDFEAMNLIRERFGPWLEIAHDAEQGHRHQNIIRQLLSLLPDVRETDPLQVATRFAQAAGEIFPAATIEVWLSSWVMGDSSKELLSALLPVYRSGNGPPLLICETLPLQTVKKEACFLIGEIGEERPSVLQQCTSFPCVVWLPLLHEEVILGVMVLGWTDSSRFPPEIKNLLSLLSASFNDALKAALAAQRWRRQQQTLQQFLTDQCEQVIASYRACADRLLLVEEQSHPCFSASPAVLVQQDFAPEEHADNWQSHLVPRGSDLDCQEVVIGACRLSALLQEGILRLQGYRVQVLDHASLLQYLPCYRGQTLCLIIDADEYEQEKRKQIITLLRGLPFSCKSLVLVSLSKQRDLPLLAPGEILLEKPCALSEVTAALSG